ncbi:MAG: PKD domain-containing protein [Euryarchaeota archaeon]|nr:PKD domain-containing protein [Euryarchaeota archaeon]
MAQTQTSRLACFLLAILILISISETGLASKFHVHAGESVQDAINGASPGDLILVESGEFNESIYVNKENLTIKSASGNPDNTHISGENAGSSVFEIAANGVNISGFSITDGRYGIFLNKVDNCTISDNKISNQRVGIYLLESGNNLLSNNMVYSNLDCGIKLLASSDNIIRANYFNNTYNARDNKLNIWNDSTGNYWSDYYGTDENGDGIGDIAYAVNPETGSKDYIPLIEYAPLPPPVLPKALFTSDVTEGYAPLSVRFKDFSENVTSRLWDFGDRNSSSSSSPLHTYFREGDYVVSLNVSNKNDSDLASVTIRVLNASKKYSPILPEAEFISNTTEGRVPLVIKFVDVSKNAECITWTFGDGKTSCCPEPEHTFCCPGNYTVSLTAGNDNGTSTACITIAVQKNESDINAKKGIGDPEGIENTGKKDSLISAITRYARGTSDEVHDDDNIIDAIENSESKSDKEDKETGNIRNNREKLESIKDSIVSFVSSKFLTKTGLSTKNETFEVQKNIESFIDDSTPESFKNSFPEIKRRISPWVPSFLGLAGVVFIVSLLKIGRRTRK